MRVHTYNGSTECNSAEFIAVEPRLAEIRQRFFDGEIKEQDLIQHIRPLFGVGRRDADWRKVVGDAQEYRHGIAYPPDAVDKWETWVATNNLYKLYYDHLTIVELLVAEKKELVK